MPKKYEALRIGKFSYSLKTRELQDDSGQPVALRSQSAEVLACLADRAGRMVSKDELIAAVWADTFVTDDSLVQCIGDIRRALGDDRHRIVQTFPKKGYRLNAAPVRPGAPARRLRWPRPAPGAALAVLAVAALAWAFLAGPFGAPQRSGDMPRIAVLPFDDFSAGPDRGYLSDAIAEGIITELARSRTFAVIARNSSFRYRVSDADMRRIAEELGVHYILEGSQQKSGNKLKVTAQLVDATSGAHIWAHSYDQEIGDLFVVQDHIIRTVADRVGIRIERPLPGSDPDRVNALHHYLAGLEAIRADYNEETNGMVFEAGRRAIAADPEAHFGYLALAFASRGAATFGWHGLDRDATLAEGLGYAQRALDIAPDDPEVHYAFARLYTETGDRDLALASFAKAIALNPSASDYLVASTTPMLYAGGQVDAAIARLEQAMGIDPFHEDWYHWQMGWALWEKDDCDGALAAMQRMKKIPRGAHRMLAGIYACLGEADKAQDAYKVFYTDSDEPTIAEQRAEWEDIWTAPGSLERWLDHMRIAGMKD